jgi:KDO2-lipid IV(A) lauroyltransferase
MCQVVDSNMQVVLGPHVSQAKVVSTRKKLLRNTGKVYYDLFHALGQGPEALVNLVEFTPQTQNYVQETLASDRGVIVVGAHASGFEIAALAFATSNVPLMALAWADPTSGYELQNRIRAVGRLEWWPIDSRALREALRRLRSGGNVATAVDRPDPFGGGEMVEFFGQPARMPVGHVRLALQTGAPILVACAETCENPRHYRVHIVQKVEIETRGSKQETILHNTRRILSIYEGVIRAHPDQWQMFYPVWAETLGQQGSEKSAVDYR